MDNQTPAPVEVPSAATIDKTQIRVAARRFCHVSRRLQHIARPDLLIILFA